jgi:hypothetical protein
LLHGRPPLFRCRVAALSPKDEPEGPEDAVRINFFRPHPLADAERPGCVTTPKAMENAMRRTLIRYKAKPEQADRNAELIAAVFAELKAARPDGTRYLSLRLEDDTFIHVVETAADDGTSALPQLAAFQAFQSGIRERCAEPPVVKGAIVVGNYRMLDEP